MSKLYKDNQNNIHSVSPIQKPKPDWIELTEAETYAHLNPPPVVVIPEQVTRAQGKVALVQANLYTSVINYIDNLPEPNKTLAQIAFNETNAWQRSSAWLNQIATDLNITQEQLDDLFVVAAGIEL